VIDMAYANALIAALGLAALAGASSWSEMAAVVGASPTEDVIARFLPGEVLSYGVGSKRVSGFFQQENAACRLVLMVIENGDPDGPLGLSPVRVTLNLGENQTAGVDSEEGRRLDFACDGAGHALLVTAGPRQDMTARADGEELARGELQ
jgi:hypothetical protein